MSHRPPFSRIADRLVLSLLLAAMLVLAGCAGMQGPATSTTPGVTPPPGPVATVAGAKALQEAQADFDAATKQLSLEGQVPTDARAKFQQVVNIVEKKVLPQVTRNDLKITAYALESFSKWQLGNYSGAIDVAEAGKKLCGGTPSNPRDCAMLQMVEGLVVASQAYEKYKNAPTMSKEDLKEFSKRLEAALHEIDKINKFQAPEALTIYANQWQLKIIREATDFWYTYFRQDPSVWKPEVLKWLGRADQVLQKFPTTPYPHQAKTLELKEEFARLKKKAEAPS